MKIIVLEGPDKLGKTTQAKRLCQATGAEYVKFPNEELYSGRVLREILNKERPFEPVSFQALQIINRIETLKLLDPEKTYVFDRWTESGYVYGALDGVSTGWIEEISALLPTPDLVLLFDGDPFGQDSDIYGGIQEKVRELYNEYALNNLVFKIHANQPEEVLAKDIYRVCRTWGVI